MKATIDGKRGIIKLSIFCLASLNNEGIVDGSV